jgi:hypothetical protein
LRTGFVISHGSKFILPQKKFCFLRKEKYFSDQLRKIFLVLNICDAKYLAFANIFPSADHQKAYTVNHKYFARGGTRGLVV